MFINCPMNGINMYKPPKYGWFIVWRIFTNNTNMISFRDTKIWPFDLSQRCQAHPLSGKGGGSRRSDVLTVTAGFTSTGPGLFTFEVTLDLVGGVPTPLKNDGLRQLGWWHSQYYGKNMGKIKAMFQSPPTRDESHESLEPNTTRAWSEKRTPFLG